MPKVGFLAPRKTLVAGAQTIRFAQSELPQNRPIAALHFDLTGGGNDLADINRIRLKRNSKLHFDCTIAQLLALASRYTRRTIATSATRLTIPCYRPSAADAIDASEYDMGLRSGTLELEVEFAGTTVAGDIGVAWTELESEPAAQPYFISGSATTIVASKTNQRYIVDPPGIVAAITLPAPATKLSKVQARFGGVLYADVSGVGLVESQAILGSSDPDPLCFRLEPPSMGPVDLVLDTTASWGASEEIAVYSALPVEV
jgi:hypothetical protein